MVAERLNAVTASIFLGLGVYNGAIALEHNNEAVNAEATVQALEAQGNPQAAEWQAIADDKEDDRNNRLITFGLYLGAAACFGTSSVTGAMARRRENDGESQFTS